MKEPGKEPYIRLSQDSPMVAHVDISLSAASFIANKKDEIIRRIKYGCTGDLYKNQEGLILSIDKSNWWEIKSSKYVIVIYLVFWQDSNVLKITESSIHKLCEVIRMLHEGETTVSTDPKR